ncbi:hypothetical protein MKW98_007296 [Papaver atlanticum]|uniref:Translation initiation factor beta propellor-like domain-containing protein n=1 Tax=Papaver atlanticum TaxID=357466 RepID=A0AAD4SC81_9MAGN|nr:hypothetical protein MKW98_007296 [Papaver atlanticum]
MIHQKHLRSTDDGHVSKGESTHPNSDDNVAIVKPPSEKCFYRRINYTRSLFDRGKYAAMPSNSVQKVMSQVPSTTNTEFQVSVSTVKLTFPSWRITSITSRQREAELSKERTHGYKLDKVHIFAVNLFDYFDKFMKVPDAWASPEIKPYAPGENLQQWLTDDKAHDQFVIRAHHNIEVFWNDPRQSMTVPVYRRLYSTESFVQWSPLGTYLATVHRQGAAVWGGAATFDRLSRYAHPQVKLIDFSSGEKYLVTYSCHEPSNPRDTQRVILNFFVVRSGKVMRDFKGSADEFATGETGGVSGVSWSVFRWGGGTDDKYFSKLANNVISVYKTEPFTLVNKKSLKAKNVLDFSWSPADPIIALFVPKLGGGNQTARVGLFQIPSKEVLRQKNLFSVGDCKMYWQSNGEYLAVKVDRYTKTKKSTYIGFQLFRIKERDIPIEVLELENKNDKIMDFAWEPKGLRFAVIHEESSRTNISFYSMRTATNIGRVSKFTTLKEKNAYALYWSPSGRFILLSMMLAELSHKGHLQYVLACGSIFDGACSDFTIYLALLSLLPAYLLHTIGVQTLTAQALGNIVSWFRDNSYVTNLCNSM